MQKNSELYINYSLSAVPGTLARPLSLTLHNESTSDHSIEHSPHSLETLAGLNLVCSLASEDMMDGHHLLALHNLDPHQGLYQNAKARLEAQALHRKNHKILLPPGLFHDFANLLKESIHKHTINIQNLTGLIDLLDLIEAKTRAPLLYNLDLHLPHELSSHLTLLTNLLFYTRALIIQDYNQGCPNFTTEGIRIDSVSDYLPKIDSISNDAAIYSHFRRLEAQMPTLVASRLKDMFQHYSAMGVVLTEMAEGNRNFHNSHKDLHENLNRLQLDWLFGADAGICYRLREELLGVREGYSRTFHLEIPEGYQQQKKHWDFKTLINTQNWTNWKAA